MITNVMVKTCLNQKIIKNRNLIQAMKNSVSPKVRKRKLSDGRILPKAEFIRTFTECSEVWIEHTTWYSWSGAYSFDTSGNFSLWQMRHRFNPRKRVNDYQRCSMLIVLPLMSMSFTLGNSSSSKLQAKIIFAGITIHWALRRIFCKIFCVSDDDKCYGENMSLPKIMKNSNLIQAMKNSVCPKARVIRNPNFSESRICPNIYRMFRSVHWTHDMIIVKWHLFIWQVRKLCALTDAPPVQSTQTGQWLSTLFHANCSAAHVYVFYPRQFIFVLSCRRRSFLQVLQSTQR